jgi:hypothetical protein
VPAAHECPTRLHEDDRIVVVEGLVVFRLAGLAWLLCFLAAGTFTALVPPAWFSAVPLLPAGWEPPLAARAAVFALFVLLGVCLALWRPAGHDPLAYALIRLRHALTPRDTVWHPVDAYAPPSPGRSPRPGDATGQSEEYAWSD